jgi:hypothetical protein
MLVCDLCIFRRCVLTNSSSATSPPSLALLVAVERRCGVALPAVVEATETPNGSPPPGRAAGCTASDADADCCCTAIADEEDDDMGSKGRRVLDHCGFRKKTRQKQTNKQTAKKQPCGRENASAQNAQTRQRKQQRHALATLPLRDPSWVLWTVQFWYALGIRVPSARAWRGKISGLAALCLTSPLARGFRQHAADKYSSCRPHPLPRRRVMLP